MNIFALHDDPVAAARDQCDRHVVKMILESAQMLSTICHEHGRPGPYKPTHAHHPCTRWAGSSAENYRWLWEHLQALLAEYTARYGKTHAVEARGLAQALWELRPDLPQSGRTPFAQAMPESYRVPDDPVAAYRAYYCAEKAAIATWKHGRVPDWFVPTPAGARPSGSSARGPKG